MCCSCRRKWTRRTGVSPVRATVTPDPSEPQGSPVSENAPDFVQLCDLAARSLGGAVLAANDEHFAAKENLILGEAPVARAGFGHRGKEYDGWETRRRRTPGHDWAIVRLGVPGIVAGVVVDTAFFTGNFPTSASVDGAAIEGHPSLD